MKIVHRSHVTSSHQLFFKFKNLKSNWQENVPKGVENDRSGTFVLLDGWNNKYVRGGNFFCSNPLGSYEQSNFSLAHRETHIVHILPMDLSREKNPTMTVHPHYFIHIITQKCQTNHFPFLRERFLVRLFQIRIWKTVAVMTSHDFCQRFSWKITKWNALAKIRIPAGCGKRKFSEIHVPN